MPFTLYQVDTFTHQLFHGNPAAVVPLEQWPEDELMQRIAAENNLAETAFFIHEGEHYHIRWFTPTVEVDLCGHATLATAFVLFEVLGYKGHSITFNSRSGPLHVTRNENMLTLDFPVDELEKTVYPQAVMDALGLNAREVYRGRSDYLVVLDNEKAVRSVEPDFTKLAGLDVRGIIITASGDEVDIVSRFFAPSAGINEDPVTGSAHTTLMAYWADKLGRDELQARQISWRSGELLCRLEGERVLISGEAVLYMRGQLFV